MYDIPSCVSKVNSDYSEGVHFFDMLSDWWLVYLDLFRYL